MLETRVTKLREKAEKGEVAESDAELITDFVDAYNPDYMLTSPPGDKSTITKHSLSGYVTKLSVVAEHLTLTDTTANEANQLMQDMLDGEIGDVNSEHTIYGYQVALRALYRYTTTIGELDEPKGEEITVSRVTGNSIDPDDMLSRDEIHDMLDSATNTRDRAVFALLIYTGMRNSALRSLRVGDVNTQEGTWKFNDDSALHVE